MASDEVISCPNTPNEMESVADEDETLVSHEDETVSSHEDETVVSHDDETVASHEGEVTYSYKNVVSQEDEQRQEQMEQEEQADDEEWENISEKEVREACMASDEMVANKTTDETEADELLVSSTPHPKTGDCARDRSGLLNIYPHYQPKAVRDTLAHISPALFPFDMAWYVLKPYMAFQGRLAAVTRHAKVIVAGRARAYDLVVRNLNNKVSLTRRRPGTTRSYKLLGGGRASRRTLSLGSLGVSVSLALAGARWIMRQVKSVLRRVARMMARQDVQCS